MHLEVKSYPTGKIVSDLAQQFDGDLSQVGEVYISSLPKKLGHGEIRGVNLPSGMSLLSFSCQFNQTTFLNFNGLQARQAQIAFINRGRLKLNLASQKEPVKMHRFQTALLELNDSSVQLIDQEKHEFFILQIDKGFILSDNLSDIKIVHDEILQMLASLESFENFQPGLFYGIDLEDLFNEVRRMELQGGLSANVRLESKTYKALHFQLKKCIQEVENGHSNRSLPEWEIDAIYMAVSYIKNNLEKEITIKQLSSLTGLNPNKLQYGFKVLSGFTVRDYLKHTRLRVAEEMIINTDLTISEIVYKIGLINRGYFSKLFKNKNGITPTEFRKRKRHLPNHSKSASA